MTKVEPWRQLPPTIAAIIEPELPAVTAEILATIGREVPEYARPLEGNFGRGLRNGVTEALRQFVALIADPDAGRGPGRDVYVALGRGEQRQGRTLDSLQSAYRVGARVAWRRLAAAARQAGVDGEVLSLLAEAIFAYIDELSAESVDGYAQAQSEREGERQRRRRALVGLLLADPPPAPADMLAATDRVGWTPSREAAALACTEDDLARLAHRLPADALTAGVGSRGCAILSDPAGPGRLDALRRACGPVPAVLGPVGPLAGLSTSWSLALAGLRAVELGAIAADGLIEADRHLATLMLTADARVTGRLVGRRLAPLAALTPKARARLERTTLAYIHAQGNAAATARLLGVHAQTARYRLAHLHELFGDQLTSPGGRFELELALRARGVSLS